MRIAGFDYLSEAGSTAAPLAFRPPPPPHLLAAMALDISPRDPRHGTQQQRQQQEEEEEEEAARGGGGSATQVQWARGLAPQHLQLRLKACGPAPPSPASSPPPAPPAAAPAPTSAATAAADGSAATAAACTAPAAAPAASEQWHYCRDYSNGGPVFELVPPPAGAPAVAGAAGAPAAPAEVEVLAVYPELGDALAAVRWAAGLEQGQGTGARVRARASMGDIC